MTNTGTLVDDLGAIRAQIAELELREKAMKASLTEAGEGTYTGSLYRATVSVADRATVPVADMKEKLEELGVDNRWFVHHTKHQAVTTVRVTLTSETAKAKIALVRAA